MLRTWICLVFQPSINSYLVNMFVKLTWKCLLNIANVWCLPTGAQTHGYLNIYQQVAVQLLADKQDVSSCLYNLIHHSKSPVSSIHQNSFL